MRSFLLSIILLLSCNVVNAEFIGSQNLHGDYTTYLHSFNGASVVDDPLISNIKYWAPDNEDVMGEVVYMFPVGETINSAYLTTSVAAFRMFDSEAESYLDVSSDGLVWSNLVSNISGPDIDVRFSGSIMDYVGGSDQVWVRARLYSGLTHWSGNSFYSQFMRGGPGGLILSVNVPEPNTIALMFIAGACCLWRTNN